MPEAEHGSAKGADGDQQLDALSRNLRRLARRLVSDEDVAEDLVQEAWLAALNQREHEVRNLNSWLRQVVRNLAGRQRRRAALRRDVERRAAQAEAVESEEALVERLSTYNHLRAAAQRLREPYRTVLLRRFFEEQSVARIAEELGRPEETVRSQVRRGLEEMRKELDREHSGKRAEWAALLLRFSGDPEAPAAATTSTVKVVAAAAALFVVTTLAVVVLLGGGDSEPGEQLGAAPVSDVGEGHATDVEARDSEREALAAVSEDSAATAAPTAPPAPAELPTRSLTVRVLRRDGVAARRSHVVLLGRDGETVREHEGEGGEVTFELEDEVLLGEPRIPGPHPGVQVYARADDEAYSATYNLPIPPEGRTLDVRSNGPAQAVFGEVRDAFGEPVAGVRLVPRKVLPGLSRTEDGVPFSTHSYIGVSDEDGRFRIDGLPVGAHAIRVRSVDHVPQELFVDERGPEVELRVVVTPGVAVEGRVVLPDGRPAAGARVWQPSPDADSDEVLSETRADEAGRYRLAGLALGEPLHLFAADAEDPELFDATATTLADGANVWDAALSKDGLVRLRVTEEDGRPVAGALCLLVRAADPIWGEIRVTDGEGRVGFPHVPEHQVALGIKRASSDPTPARVVPAVERSGRELSVTLPPAPELDGSFRGTVLDARSRPFAKVAVLGARGGHSFNAPADPRDGTFTAHRLGAGTYTLWALVEGSGAVPLGSHELVAGEAYDVGTVRAEERGTVTIDWQGTVPERAAAWVVRVEMPKSAFRERDCVVLTEPVTELGLLPGTYRLVRAGGEALTGLVFQVRSGATTSVRLP